MNRLVIYHGSCMDGFASAWAAWRRFGDVDTHYHAAHYGEPFPNALIEGTNEIYIVDFSYPRPILNGLLLTRKQIRIFDHHRTAQAALADLPGAIFDMERSGAGITWDVLHPDTPRPWLINFVEDRDLWRFALPDSKMINAYIGLLDMKFSSYEAAAGKDFTQVRPLAEGAFYYLNRYVREVVKAGMFRTTLRLPDGTAYHNVPVVNAPYKGCSEIGEALYEDGSPITLTWRQLSNGRFTYSLRSPTTGPDVSAIAAHFGGGGHFHAAGFVSDKLVFEMPKDERPIIPRCD